MSDSFFVKIEALWHLMGISLFKQETQIHFIWI